MMIGVGGGAFVTIAIKFDILWLICLMVFISGIRRSLGRSRGTTTF